MKTYNLKCKALATKIKNISGCIVNIRSAKNDSAGRGHRYFFSKCNPATDKSTYCITWILWRNVQHARPGSRLPFFHIPKLQWTLKPPYFNKRLQAKARMYDLDPRRISSHSLRIGGATAMAAACRNERVRNLKNGRLEVGCIPRLRQKYNPAVRAGASRTS